MTPNDEILFKPVTTLEDVPDMLVDTSSSPSMPPSTTVMTTPVTLTAAMKPDTPCFPAERAYSTEDDQDMFDTTSVLSEEVSVNTPSADDTDRTSSASASAATTPATGSPRGRMIRGKGSNILNSLKITMVDIPRRPPRTTPTPKPTAPRPRTSPSHSSLFSTSFGNAGIRIIRRGPGRPRKDMLRRADMVKVHVKDIKQLLQREYYEAARGSRLMFTVMSPQEKEIFGRALRYLQLPVYLHIRNGILRLWLQNPRFPLSLEKAMRVKQDHRYDDKYDNLLRAIYEFLVRYGYINFGYLQPSPHPTLPLTRLHLGPRNDSRQKTVVIIGGGMAGIACARQLHFLFSYFAPAFAPHPIPSIVLLEARGRIGGRVFSYPLHTPVPPDFEESLRSANASVSFPRRPIGIDLGAQIITGFEGGNPMDVIVRRQLRLPIHILGSNDCHLIDTEGKLVGEALDQKCDAMFNETLDLACGLKREPEGWSEELVEFLLRRGDATGNGEGEKALVEREPCKQEAMMEDWDLFDLGTPLSSEAEEDTPSPSGERMIVETIGTEPMPTVDAMDTMDEMDAVDAVDVVDVVAGEIVNNSNKESAPASVPNEEDVKSAVNSVKARYLKGQVVPTLGNTMDYFLETHPEFKTLTAAELAVVHWHYANLEFANATPLDRLSLDHWDQDDGHEFYGNHAMVKGGYGQVPHAIALGPKPLDIRLRKPVKTVRYGAPLAGENDYPVHITCRDGSVLEADTVVMTTPLGVLKAGDIAFEPELPDWKQEAIDRLGFGNLNKLVLVFPHTFWDTHADMFGAIMAPNKVQGDNSQNGYHPKVYSDIRGEFYMFWNCIPISGLPVLIGLMAGTSANTLESSTDAELTQQALDTLARLHPTSCPLPSPLETVVTRWSQDEFARGSYSYVGPRASGDDYDALARPVQDHVFFAGEATSRHYPATVHGAYLSGVRAAQEIADLWLGRMGFANRKALFEGMS